MQEVRNSSVWVWCEIKDVNSVKCLKSLSIWITNEMGKEMLWLKNSCLTLVIGSRRKNLICV